MRKVLYLFLLLFFSIINNLNSQCHYLMYMYDSYGDGWNSAYLEVNMNGNFVGNFDCSQSFTLDSCNRFTKRIKNILRSFLRPFKIDFTFTN